MCDTPLILRAKEGASDGYHCQQVPCGKCEACIKRRVNAWAFRFEQQCKVSSSVAFVTFTYDDEHIPYSRNGLQTLVKKEIPEFMRTLRHKCPHRLKYYAVGEYGGITARPHYHAIMFNLPIMMVRVPALIQDIWKKGMVHSAPGNIATFKYVAKYVQKSAGDVGTHMVDLDTGEMIEDDRIKKFSLVSKGIGLNFLTPAMTEYMRKNLSTYFTVDGRKVAIPRYYKDKVFTEEEKMVINMINQQEVENSLAAEDPILTGNRKMISILGYEKRVSIERQKI